MARNGSGTMSATNSFSSGSQIASSPMNANFTDIASEITNSLPRDGQAGMTGQMKAANGTVAAPGVTFDSDTDTGFYRSAGNTIGVAAGGAAVGSFSSSGYADANGLVVVGLPTGLGPLPWSSTTAPTGWVRCNGRTIGSASSGATERANADCEDLFEHLWTNFADGVCAVSTGRGASAAADWSANKTIAMLDLRGRAVFGTDDMGNSAASRLGTIVTTPTTIGSVGGTETHTLTTAESAAHTHTATTSSDGAHTHTTTLRFTALGAGSAVNGYHVEEVNGSESKTTSSNGAHTHTLTTTSTGGGGAHTNLPPAIVLPYIMKL